MNKPAPKEPSMDEILSSIRQIIADDDAAAAPKRPILPQTPPAASVAPAQPAPNLQQQAPVSAPRPIPTFAPSPAPTIPTRAATPEPRIPAFTEPETAPEPLALRPEQIVSEAPVRPEHAPMPSFASAPAAPAPMSTPTPAPQSQQAVPSFASILGETEAEDMPDAFGGEPELVDPEDVAFDVDEDDEAEAVSVAPVAPAPVYTAPPVTAPISERPRPAFAPPTNVPPAPASLPRHAPVAQTAPMPDPTLSSDMAEQLLEPTTGAAVKSTLSRLSGLSMVGQGVTIEAMMREMLRPMLKEWLDENLPAVVERMVEKEIARISRGAE